MTEQRPIQSTPVGVLRFNTDSAKLEYFDGNQYVNITTDSPVQHTGGTHGLFGGGATPSDEVDTIDFINIASTGNATDFGNLTLALIFCVTNIMTKKRYKRSFVQILLLPLELATP